MSTKPKAQDLRATAKAFADQLARTIDDTDPARERAFQEREAKRDAEVTKALKQHLAKKRKVKG